MQDRELYRRILGIESPWYVKSVDLKLDVGEVHVHLAHEPVTDWQCPECESQCKLYDHQPERQWRHLDTCQYQTILHAEPPRSQCPQHGVKVVKLPWAEPASRFTELFEAVAIERLKAEVIPQIGIDEKAFRKGHTYLTLVNDLVGHRVLYVAPERKESSLDGFWASLTAEQLEGIEAVAMDMWDAYINSVRAHVAEADDKIVFDKFHVAQHLGEAV